MQYDFKEYGCAEEGENEREPLEDVQWLLTQGVKRDTAEKITKLKRTSLALPRVNSREEAEKLFAALPKELTASVKQRTHTFPAE